MWHITRPKTKRNFCEFLYQSETVAYDFYFPRARFLSLLYHRCYFTPTPVNAISKLYPVFHEECRICGITVLNLTGCQVWIAKWPKSSISNTATFPFILVLVLRELYLTNSTKINHKSWSLGAVLSWGVYICKIWYHSKCPEIGSCDHFIGWEGCEDVGHCCRPSSYITVH